MNELLPYVTELKAEDNVFDLDSFVPAGMPLEVEIGCGNGRFLAANAFKRPDTFFIGVERMMDRLRRCSRKAVRGAFPNLRFIRVEAGRFVHDLLPDRRVSVMHLFFPDPWPKRRHHKNRFFQREMTDTLARLFIPGGIMNISTDHEEYFKEMHKYLSEDDRFEEIPPIPRPEDEQTDFERLFLSKSAPIHSCAFRLKAEA